MLLARRKFVSKMLLGVPLMSGYSVSSLFQNGFVHKNQVRFEFKLIFPKNKNRELVFEDLKRIFPTNNACKVDDKFISNGLAWRKVNKVTDEYHSMKMTFKDLNAYNFWERKLEENSSYDKSLLNSLGYRFVTNQIS